nr:reverse transcriptase domain-containing protein [Tanacetum cinerariifolium]
MSTHSSARNLFPPLDNTELTIRRRSRTDPTLLSDFKMATEGNGDPPVPDLRTMEEFIKVNEVTDEALRLYLFPHSLTRHATAWFDRLPRNSINTFEQMAKMFLGKYFSPSIVTKLRNEITNFRQRPDESLFEARERYKLSIDRCPNHNMLPVTQRDTFYNGLTLRHRDTINAAAGGTFMKRRPKECYFLIENMTGYHNDWDTSAQRSESSSSITTSSNPEIIALKAEMAKINKNLMKVLQIIHHVKAVTPSCETCGGPHSYNNCPATVGQTPRTYMLRKLIKVVILTNLKMNTASSSGSRTLPSNTVTNPKEDLKGITTQSENAYQGPTIPTTPSSSPKVVARETEVTKDTPVVAPVVEPVVAPVSALKPNPKPSTSYPSRIHDQKLRNKTNDQKEKIFQIFKDLDFNINFTDALILMSKFVPTFKSLLTNKVKLYELARTPLNEHCSTVLLKKLPEKLGDPGKFLFPCDFLGMDECLALADLGASINLMPLFVWNKLFLPELTPTLITLELADRYSTNYNDMTANRIDLIEMAYEEYSQEVLGFSDVIASGNPTSYYDSIVSTCSSTLTPFGDSDILLEEVDAFLALEDDLTSPEVDHSYYDTEGDILLLEAFLNDDPSLPPPNQRIYLSQVQKELKICEAKNDKYSIDEPPEVELKDLPPHLEHAFLECDDKFPIIIAKDLSVDIC